MKRRSGRTSSKKTASVQIARDSLNESIKSLEETLRILKKLRKLETAGKAHSDVRRLGKAEAVGSIPIPSSKRSKPIDKRVNKYLCQHCKHMRLIHDDKGCRARICDAAGDMDWCPCSRFEEKPLWKSVKRRRVGARRK